MNSLDSTPSQSIVSLIQSDTTVSREMSVGLTDDYIANIEADQFQMIMRPNLYRGNNAKIKNKRYGLPQSVTQLLDYNKITNEDILFHKKGYRKIKKICDTLQGELYKAEITKKWQVHQNADYKYVAIKRTSKSLTEQRIAMEDDMCFCVSESILKEALILKHLTVDNQPIGHYIVQYIDFFESETDYYLVLQYIDSEINLKQFICKSRQYIKCGKLSLKEYQTMMKYLLWQLCVTVQWLHISMHCCHLDICSENILLHNAKFIQTDDGMVSIDPHISVKLCDFGVAEVFNTASKAMFLCGKQELTLDRTPYLAPKVFANDKYDARKADSWSLGMLLFETMTVGQSLYKPMTMYDKNSGYQAIHHHKLKEFLYVNHLLKYFDSNSFSLLNDLLNVDDSQRSTGTDILTHQWFSGYFNKYKKQIGKKFDGKNVKLNSKLLPMYKLY